MKKSFAVLLSLIFLIVTMVGPAVASDNPFAQGYVEGYLKNIIIVPEVTETASASPAQKRAAAKSAPQPSATITKLEIETYEGGLYQIELSPTAALSIDQIPVTINDFRPGIEIYGDIQGRTLISLEGYSTASMGYQAPGNRMQQGTIKKIDRDQIQVQMQNGVVITGYTTPATIVLNKGQNVTTGSLYVGDRVKLFFDQAGSNIISRMQVEGDSIEIKNIYLGTLQTVDRVEDLISLEDIQTLDNGTWQNYKTNLQLPYNSKTPIYVGAQRIAYQNLKYYQGKQIYMAVANKWGEQVIEKMVVKAQYETDYNDKIETVNWYSEALELENHQNIAFSDGTIVIKDGRLVDKYVLNEGSDAVIMADGRLDTKTASLIYILNEGINNSNISQSQIYAAELNELTEKSLWLDNYFVINGNQWESFSKEKELFYDQDSAIYDLENTKLISSEEFLTGDYVSSDSTANWYAYLYTDGDRVVAALLKKNSDSLLRQRTSSGIIENLSEDASVGWTVDMRESRDWSSRNDKWMLRDSNLKFSVANALLIKDNKMIKAEDLSVGDRLYVLRDDFQARVVLVK